MADSMIERMARTIADGVWGPGHADIYFDPLYAKNPDVRRVACITAARGVLTAMREPTEAMSQQGQMATKDASGNMAESSGSAPWQVSASWQAMIDAALEEG